MKKTLLLFLFSICAFAKSNATGYVTTKDAVRSSYKDVNESGDSRAGFMLKCEGAGGTQCKYKDGHVPPMVKARLDIIDDAVTGSIQSNQLFGTENFDGGFYSWQTTADGEITTSVTFFD